MDAQRRYGAAVSALIGLIAVAAGAFGAHAAGDPGARELLRTGAQYQGLHALAALVAFAALPALRGSGLAGWLLATGALLFGGSLDLLAAGAPRMAGAITPLGGLLMMAGWLVLALGAMRSRPLKSRPFGYGVCFSSPSTKPPSQGCAAGAGARPGRCA